MKVRMIAKAAALFAACSLLFLACQNSSGGSNPNPPPPAEPIGRSEWTSPAANNGTSEAFVGLLGDALFDGGGKWDISLKEGGSLAEGTYSAEKLVAGGKLDSANKEIIVTKAALGSLDVTSFVKSVKADVAADGKSLTVDLTVEGVGALSFTFTRK